MMKAEQEKNAMEVMLEEMTQKFSDVMHSRRVHTKMFSSVLKQTIHACESIVIFG